MCTMHGFQNLLPFAYIWNGDVDGFQSSELKKIVSVNNASH